MSKTSVGQIGLDLKVNGSNIQSQLQKAVNNPLKNVNKTISGSLTSGFKKLGRAVVSAFAIQKVVQFGKACLKLGSDLAEVQNVVDVTFGSGATSINKWAKTTIKAYGVSEVAAKQYSGTMGAMLKSMGLTTDTAQGMSMRLAELSGDLASFYNLDTDEAFTKIRSGISGETEPLKQLGINMSVANLEAYALSQGITKSYNAMTQAEKVLLRYNYLLEVTSDAQGDFSRTSGGWANQTRVLKLNFDSLKATIGQLLINCLLPLVKVFNNIVESANRAATAVADFFGVTNQASGGAGAAAMAGATGDAAENLDDANNSAKKLKKSLAGFDKLNIIGSKDTDASSGASSITPSDGASAADSGTVESLKKTNALLDEIKQKARELKDSFKEGFNIGFNNTSLNNFKSHLSNIKQSLSNIVSDKDVQSSASNFLDKLARNLGKGAGSLGSVGTTIGEFITGSFDKYLGQHGPGVSDRLVSIFDVSGEISDIVGNVSVTLADLFSIFRSDDAKQVGADIINIFSDPFLTVKENALKLTRDIADALSAPFIENKDEIKNILEEILFKIREITGKVSEVVSDICAYARQKYDEKVKPMFDDIKDGLKKIVDALLKAYKEHIKPVLDKWAANFIDLWENHIGPTAKKIIDFFGKVCELVGIVWKQYLAPLIAWLIEKFAPIVASVLDRIGTIAHDVFSGLVDAIGGLTTAFGGVIDFLIGVFTGDWARAWQGVRNIFKGIWDSFVGIAKAPLNVVIDLLNKVIKGLNKIKIDIPDWVRELTGIKAKSWGFNIGTIPRLAQGGYVKANTPQLAMIGDNKHEGEIVSPESKLHEIFGAEIAPLIAEIRALVAAVRGMTGGSSGGQTIKLYVDGKQLFEWFVKQNNSIVRQTGKSPLKV